eukprot:1161274-Pelagomonas_calceolata.AAC.2
MAHCHGQQAQMCMHARAGVSRHVSKHAKRAMQSLPYSFVRHAGAAGSRRWSALARWRLRELNELPHYCSHRLDAAHAPACHYCAQASAH